MTQQSDPKIIVALDFDQLDKARALVAQLDPGLCALKVGKEMFTWFGPDFVRDLVDRGFRVFLDLKFHDIPNTVAKACRAAAELGVWMVDVHASGGGKMIQAAADALAEYGENRPRLIAVTVLTSMDEEEFGRLGYQRDIASQVENLAKLACENGADGIVCSAHEVSELRRQLGRNFLMVTPGIRPAGSQRDDQSRVMTPQQAIDAGASYLVIGRPITKADDPPARLCEISESFVSQ